MLVINLCAVVTALAVFIVIAYIGGWLIGILVAVVVVMAGVSIASDIVASKLLGIGLGINGIFDIIGSVVFVLTATLLSRWLGMAVYCAFVILYCLLNLRKIKNLFISLIKKEQTK